MKGEYQSSIINLQRHMGGQAVRADEINVALNNFKPLFLQYANLARKANRPEVPIWPDIKNFVDMPDNGVSPQSFQRWQAMAGTTFSSPMFTPNFAQQIDEAIERGVPAGKTMKPVETVFEQAFKIDLLNSLTRLFPAAVAKPDVEAWMTKLGPSMDKALADVRGRGAGVVMPYATVLAGELEQEIRNKLGTTLTGAPDKTQRYFNSLIARIRQGMVSLLGEKAGLKTGGSPA